MTFDPDYLIHIANVILLAAFVVRDILLLRILFVTGSFFAFGFYFFQSPPLWSAIGWTALYIVIHAFWICRILWERRPVVLNPDEQRLYDLGFGALDLRKFVTVVSLGEWRDGKPGEYIFRKGDPVSEIAIHVSGAVSMRLDGTELALLRPGNMIGTAVVLTSGTAPCDAVLEEPCRYLALSLPIVRELMAKDPELRDQVRVILNQDLSKKLLQVVSLGAAAEG